MTTTITSSPLSTALREQTAEAHEMAENATFISRLLDGSLNADAIAALLAQMLPVYEAMEAACASAAGDPRFAPLHDEVLNRSESLRADLAAHRAAGRGFDRVLPSTEAYVAELERIEESPAELVGHHYVRYLGDLSGGQIIARLVRRHYGLEEGLSFYDFRIAKPKVYKDLYRAALDELPLTPAEREATVAAAIRSFGLSHRMFLELGEVVGV